MKMLAEEVYIPTRGIPVMSRSRVKDYVELVKPRIAVMVLFTVAVGFVLGNPTHIRRDLLFHVLFGTGLVAVGANTLNQWLERRTDGLMLRTQNRPLPSGRLAPLEALLFGLLSSLFGIFYLYYFLPQPESCLVAALTLISYVSLYTPLKRMTWLNTVVGAIPGALPPVIGWCASHSHLDSTALSLFGILFFWQLPHFSAIAWMYREDYTRGGLEMVSVRDPRGTLTARVMMITCLMLVLMSVYPVIIGKNSILFFLGSILLGIWFLAATIRFNETRSTQAAKRVLRVSVLYLAGILAIWLLDATVLRAMLPGMSWKP